MGKYPRDSRGGSEMQKVIGRKTIDQIQVGDVVGLIGNWLNWTDQYDERLVTVLDIQETDGVIERFIPAGTRFYLVTCSDAHTYTISSMDRKYFIFAKEVK
jgi:hypothetical protein